VYAVLLAGQAGAAPRLAVTTPLPEMVATLNAFQPEALTAYPSVAGAVPPRIEGDRLSTPLPHGHLPTATDPHGERISGPSPG
jgi:hypothetical protein